MAETSAALRAQERVGAAVVRALSGAPSAEFRAQRLTLDDIAIPLATPYLALDLSHATAAQRRGVADALGLMLLHSDRTLHTSLSPEPLFERLLFDVLEQLRCESLASPALPGLKANLRASFHCWCDTARSERIHESFIGLLLFTVLHMARHRLIDPLRNEEDEDIIETTRGRLGRFIGGDLRELTGLKTDQSAYAAVALRVCAAVAALGGEEASALDSSSEARARTRLQIPDWNPEDEPTLESTSAPLGSGAGRPGDTAADLDAVGGYHIYTRAYDSEVAGAELYRPEVQAELRAQMDDQVAAQAVSIPRLALGLQNLLSHPHPDGWRFGTEDGLLDSRRLAQLIANPAYTHLFRDQPMAPRSHTAVTFLVDNSGSMKAQKYESVAVLLDTFSRALDRIDIPVEVLGFSTVRWNGGRPRRVWQAAGAPEDPGRLTELQHIVYKDASSSWKRSRRSLACMLRTHHYRESVDGEALAWAYGRLLQGPEPRKLLVMISDGAPMDSSTANSNRTAFLGNHLSAVARNIERAGQVELSAVTIDASVSGTFTNSVALDLSGTLTLAMYSAVAELFQHHY